MPPANSQNGLSIQDLHQATKNAMIMLPIISLGFLILCLMGALISFQYYSHFQSLIMLERARVVGQRQRAQSALGFLVAFSFGALIALGGLIFPVLIGYTPEPFQPEITETPLSGTSPELPSGESPGEPAAPQSSPTTEAQPTIQATPTVILPRATIGNTGGAGANVRSIPGLGGTVIEILTDGTRVILLDENREVDGFEWQSIEMEDTRQGWVVVQFLIPDN